MFFNEKFLDVINHKGVVSIVTCGDGEAHVSNTWNDYLTIVDENKILIPAAGMMKTERYTKENPLVKLTVGSHEVMGYMYMGTGFYKQAAAECLNSKYGRELPTRAGRIARTIETGVFKW